MTATEAEKICKVRGYIAQKSVPDSTQTNI